VHCLVFFMYTARERWEDVRGEKNAEGNVNVIRDFLVRLHESFDWGGYNLKIKLPGGGGRRTNSEG